MKLFLDSKEHLLQKLIDKFSHLSTAEEKMHLIELFLEDCCREIISDINWKSKQKFLFKRLDKFSIRNRCVTRTTYYVTNIN